MKKVLKIIGIILLALAVAWTMATLLNTLDEVESSRVDRAELHERLDRQRSTADALADQIRGLGHDPVLDPGVTPEERFTPVPGKDGQDGKDGRPGTDGSDGRDGADSNVPGPKGDSIRGRDGSPGESIAGPRGPAGESIRGPAGPAGRDGKDGADSTVPGPEGPSGRGIEAMTCVGPRTTFTITRTDGTTSEVQCGR